MVMEALKIWLMENLCGSVLENAKLCRDVHEEALNLKDDMESMRSIFRAADRSNDSDDTRKRSSLKRARAAVFDAEDVLDKYMLCFQENHHRDGHSFWGLLRKKARSIMQLNDRYRIASEMRLSRIKITEERREYEQSAGTEQSTGSSSPNNNHHHQLSDPRLLALFFAGSDLVGIDKPRDELIEMLQLGEEENLLTISVVGMGGLGKTTLAKMVYEQVKGSFQTYACIPVLQTFKGPDIFQMMITEFQKAKMEQLETATEMDAMSQVELIQVLRDYLENKSFLLVLDDLWDVNAWKSLRAVLPHQQQRGSRVILTTRKRDIAKFCCARAPDRIYDLKPLDAEKAWSLFSRRAFQRNKDSSCPPCLQELAQNFVNKCRGLPLALIALGSLLSVKHQNCTEWELIYRSIGSELETDDHLKGMKRILLLSFNDLPHKLRSCFLSLSIFPEDYPIKRMKLIRLWVAQGLIESKEGRSLEEVADAYLNQLIRRSLIQVAELKHDETVRTCQLHNIIRDMIISKYKEQSFFASSSSSSSVQQDTLQQLSDGIRHLSIHNKGEAIGRYDKFTRLRSLFIFGVDGPIASFAGLRWLRVVDFENVPMESFPVDLTQLLLLRYLSLENTKIKNLPNSVEKLKRLETLNLKGTSVCELPAGILKLQCLRHLLVYKYHYYDSLNPFNCISGVKVPAGFGRLKSLQKVGLIEAETGIVRELGNLTELRRLCIKKLRREDGVDFCASVAKMSHLQALDVISIREDVVLELQSLSCPPALQRVYLSGLLENLPQWIPSIHNLVSLRLCWSRMKDDPLKALQSLTNLVELDLIQAYDGEELCFGAGGYPKLKILFLEMRRLKKLRVEDASVPSLEILTVSHCDMLVEVPLWLQQLTNMKRFSVLGMPKEFVQSLYHEGGGEWADYVQHIPSIKLG